MLSVAFYLLFMLSVIMLNVVMVSVVGPFMRAISTRVLAKGTTLNDLNWNMVID